MTSELQVKEVNFDGDQLIAVQVDGCVYTIVKRVCEFIGLTEGQTNRQMLNMHSDLVISKGVSNLILPTNGGKQSTLCIMINFLPLWLAKISITPAMQKTNPVLVDKLINYQIKAKDVLANAFLPEETKGLNPYDLLLKNINDNQRLLVVEQSKLSDKLSQHLETYAEDKEAFNQTALSIGYEIEDLKQQVNKEVIERTSYIPVKPLVAKKMNVLNKVREIMITKWVNSIKHQATKDDYTNRINYIIDDMITNRWTISDFKAQFDRQDRMYAGDDALIHEIGLIAYKYYTGSRIA